MEHGEEAAEVDHHPCAEEGEDDDHPAACEKERASHGSDGELAHRDHQAKRREHRATEKKSGHDPLDDGVHVVEVIKRVGGERVGVGCGIELGSCRVGVRCGGVAIDPRHDIGELIAFGSLDGVGAGGEGRFDELIARERRKLLGARRARKHLGGRGMPAQTANPLCDEREG